eukprot:4050613-Pleurochrysis_carterae.AAC.1
MSLIARPHLAGCDLRGRASRLELGGRGARREGGARRTLANRKLLNYSRRTRYLTPCEAHDTHLLGFAVTHFPAKRASLTYSCMRVTEPPVHTQEHVREHVNARSFATANTRPCKRACALAN